MTTELVGTYHKLRYYLPEYFLQDSILDQKLYMVSFVHEDCLCAWPWAYSFIISFVPRNFVFITVGSCRYVI